MSVSFYDLTVTNYLQVADATAGVLAKGRAHCEAEGIDLGEIYEMKLAPDMLPFWFQIGSVRHHSLGAIKGIESGVFEPPTFRGGTDYADLQAMIDATRDELRAYTPEAIEALQDKNLVFKLGAKEMPFTAGDFVMSFSLPNFHFHATTTYDMLRIKGTELGKLDFLGQLRLDK